MNVRYMAGIGCSCDSGMGATILQRAAAKVTTATKQATTAVKTATQKSGAALVTGGLAGGRLLFLAMVKKNLDGFATKLQKIDANKLKSSWEKAGGNYATLVAAIKTGSSVPAKKLGFLAKVKDILAKKGIKGLGATGDAEVQAAIVAVATALGTAIAPAAGTAAGASIGAVLSQMYPVVRDMIIQVPASDTGAGDLMTTDIASDLTDSESGTSTSFDFSKMLPYIAIGGAVLYFVLKKKK